MSEAVTSSHFKENAHEALTDARLQGALGFSRNFVGRRAAAIARLPESMHRETAPVRSRITRSLISTSISRPTSARRGRAAAKSTTRRTPRKPPDRHRPLQVDGRKERHQGQVDDRRGDRPQPCSRGRGDRAGRNRPRRIHHPIARRTPSHVIAPAIHLTAKDVEQEFRKAHRDLPPDRSPRRARAAGQRGAPGAAGRSFSLPTSGSPAPISSSPRPEPRSSSPTKATAT